MHEADVSVEDALGFLISLHQLNLDVNGLQYLVHSDVILGIKQSCVVNPFHDGCLIMHQVQTLYFPRVIQLHQLK